MLGDDFTVTGPTADLQWMQRRMGKKYEIKTHYIGPESGMKDEIQILNRTLRWTEEGITYEADQRHSEIVIKEMNMKKAKAVSTLIVPEPSEEANLRLNSPDMTKDGASRFRGLVARVNYLSLDRPNLQCAAKTASQHMAQPKVCDWAKIKRIARYLVKASLAVQKFAWQGKPRTSQRTSTQTGRATRSRGNPPAAARCFKASI